MLIIFLGKPSSLFDEDNEDWAPTLNMGHGKIKKKSKASTERDERNKLREDKRRRSDVAEALLVLHNQLEQPKGEGTSELLVEQGESHQLEEQPGKL